MANLNGIIKTPLGNTASIDLRITPLDNRGDMLISLAETVPLTGSYSIPLEEGYYYFDYSTADVWTSIGDGFISSSQSASIQEIVNVTNTILLPTVGATVSGVIYDVSGSIHTFSFENGLLKSWNVS